jgi:hypothetical protein
MVPVTIERVCATTPEADARRVARIRIVEPHVGMLGNSIERIGAEI